MQSKWLGRIGLAALVAGVAGSSGGAVGCAAERDPINRVQLNAIPKSFLVGEKYNDPSDDPEFYARTMVIDVPYGESGSDFLMFTNTINSVSKIKWSIEGASGDFLVGRVSFERIDGTDKKGIAQPTAKDRDPNVPLAQNDGIVVYQFRIRSHFDVRRAYNSQTGEESNVIEENASDRPWNERDYVRVDFSENLVTAAYDFDTLSLLGVYNGIKYTSAPLFVENPKDENAPAYDLDGGYFDVTNKVFAEPQMLDLGGMKFPGCMLPSVIQGGTEPTGNCNPNEITLRHSFKRVTNTDYEPVDWDGARFESYGAFFSNRNGYARDYGLVDKNWRRFINRYNIWERHHAYKDAVKMEGPTVCKADADCGDVGSIKGASHCDTVNSKCTLPYADRKEKPIIWHYTDKNAPQYFDVTREATEEWDTAIRVAVGTARYAECQRFTPGECGAYPILNGNFAEEEDALYLTKEMQACRRGELPNVYKPSANREEREAAQLKTTPCDAHVEGIARDRGYSESVVLIAKAQPMVTLCHSPVAATDALACGKVGEVARLGDLRHHLVTNIAVPQTNSPWGIMSDANDPVTGERVAASINVWTHVNDLFSRGLIDTLRYIGGELKTEDITDGKYVDQWVAAAKNLGSAGITPVMTTEEVDKRVAAAANTTVEKLHAAEARGALANAGKAKFGQESALKKALVNNMKRVQQTHAAFDAPSTKAPLYEARRNLIKGSPVEAEVITPAMQQLASAQYGQLALDSATKATATSIFQGLSPQMRRSFEQRRELSLAARGACVMNFEATAPLGYVALGDQLQQKFGKFNPNEPADIQMKRADQMKTWLAGRAHYAVIAHEMGHSFALRHNFVSSSDPWNYRWQYWALRTNGKDKVSNSPCPATGTPDGKSCSGPRWLDPETANERKNMIQMWAHSSTMEYAGEPTQDLLGLGAYDFGAARMFYGDANAVYADARFKKTADAGTVAMAHQNEFGGLLGYRFGDFSNPIHYSQLDANFNLIEKCSPVDPQVFRPSNWDEAKDGIWNPVVDGHLVTNEDGKTIKCTQPKVDFVQWDTLKNTEDKTHAHDSKDRVRVPHGFASDEWADLGNIAVYRHDNGADVYELMHFWIAQQEINHIFTNYRRGRRDFSIWGAFNRTLGRYHEKMRDSAKAIALYVNLARDTVSLYNSGTDPQGFVAEVLKQVAVDNTVASAIAFDHFAHVYARPQPGEHGAIGEDDTVLRSFEGTGFANATRPILSIANGVTGGFGAISLGGRPIENALARDKGRDYDRDYTLNVGSYYEKAFTAMLFAESADNFISSSRDDFVDPRFRSVSIADVFPDGFRRWLGNNLTGDDAIKGVQVVGTGNGPGPQPPQLDANGFALLGQTSWWPTQGIESCYPQGERLYCRDPFAATPVNAAGSGGVVDPQVGWEQQKFAMMFTLWYLPDNQKVNWLDQMRIYELGSESDPGFENRIEYHDPDGRVYVAQTYGTETLFGKTVQKGIAARVLEYANSLLVKSVATTTVTKNGTTWYLPVIGPNGTPTYKQGANTVASCDNSRECLKLRNYTSVPALLRQSMRWFGHIPMGGLKGVY